MSLLKVTPHNLVNVCVCGAENDVDLKDVVLDGDAVVLPICPHCKDCVTCVLPGPYEDGWEDMEEAAVKRQLMAQYAHFFATHHPESQLASSPSVDSKTKEAIIHRMQNRGCYEFVDETVSKITNEVHPLKWEAWDYFNKNRSPMPQYEKRPPLLPKDRVFKSSLKNFAAGRGELQHTRKPVVESD
jgi:hypothetical protein